MRMTTALLGVLLLLATPAVSRTWRVEKDGSGDFTTIQPAVNAAAAGDTIAIGPGRFTEMTPFSCPGWTEDVCVAVTKSRLVMIGAGAESTFIGPETREYPPTTAPKGLAVMYTTDFVLLDCSVENTRDGLYCSQGHLRLSACTFRGCDLGVIAWADGGMQVQDCRFLGNTGDGLFTTGPSQNIVVERCEFTDNEKGASFNNGTANAMVENCVFSGGRVGTQFSVDTSGSATNCRFNTIMNVAIYVSIASEVSLNRNVVAGGATHLDADSNCHVSGSGNIFGGGTYSTPTARGYLSEVAASGTRAAAAPQSLWMHVLAIAHSPAYLNGIRQDWPRIPLPAKREALLASAELGKRIAALLDVDTAVPGVTAGTISPEYRDLGVIQRSDGKSLDPEAGDLELTAGWGHAGKAGVVMPGRGKFTDHGDALDIWLNDRAYWRNVPRGVWEYTIGGYQVIKKWLSYREKALLGRPLTPEEARYVTEMVRRIAALIAMQPELDANYEAVRSDTVALPGSK